MEPKELTPNNGLEQSSAEHGRSPENPAQNSSPELQFGGSHERFEQRSEARPATVSAPPILPAPVAVPLPSPPAPISDDSASPIVAADEDLIEKDWVDRAKKIIQQTKDDPYRREQEVNKLQADYLRKRYGREIGTPQ
ncbi:MAG: hypothetical protein ABIR91_05090 [Candidatus Saccharimonadales bacterium]